MASFDTTYTFTAGTQVPAAEFNTNFADIEAFLNDSVMHVDGSKAFTGLPALPASDPTSDNQPARKKYVDDRHGILVKRIHSATSGLSTGATMADLGVDLPTFAFPNLTGNGRVFRISLFVPILRLATAGNVTDKFAVEIRTAGGTVVTSGGAPMTATVLAPDATSLYLQRTFYDNTWAAAGLNLTLSIFGALALGGRFQLKGTTDAPIEFLAEMV